MRILITGRGGYIGAALAASLTEMLPDARVSRLSLRGDDWKEALEGFDVIIHAAAIVHQGDADDSLCRRVNCDLTAELAKRAKDAGASQFIFLSTMAVYGLNGSLDETQTIHASTPEAPKTPYGSSKLEAERAILPLQDAGFDIAILRLPMVYGADCPGNYARLRRLMRYLPVFPDIDNMRSAISTDTLCECVSRMVEARACGTFFPRDASPMNTAAAAEALRGEYGKRLIKSRALGCAVRLFKRNTTVKKLFGSLVYHDELPICP